MSTHWRRPRYARLLACCLVAKRFFVSKRTLRHARHARVRAHPGGSALGVKTLIVLACLGVLVGLFAEASFTAEAQRSAEATHRLPVIYWAQGIETAPTLKQAGIEQIATSPDKADEWRKAGFNAMALNQVELERREKLAVPRIAGRADVASATRRPWIDANGWRFVRNPVGKFYYQLPAGKAALAAVESYAYQADAILKIDPADLVEMGKALAFLRTLPSANHLPIADIGVIDDRSPALGEVMNLLTRRNLLFQLVPAPVAQFRVNIKLGSKAYPQAAAADPSLFALKIRRELGDDNRTLRIYGTEVIIGRLTGADGRAQLQLLNYSGREAVGLRVRLRGKYAPGQLQAYGVEQSKLEDVVVADGATEFSIPKLGIYAMIELPVVK